MDDNKLDQLLRSATVPERPETFWRELPKRISARIHWQGRQERIPERNSSLFPRFALVGGLGLAAACLVFLLSPKPMLHKSPGFAQLDDAKKYYNEIASLFPNQVQGIMFDKQGTHLMLADKPDVPNSPAYYVKVCTPSGCKGFVTFSGQQISLNGEKCEVLADQGGHVFLVGDDGVWRAGQSSGAIRIEARALSASL